MTKKMTISFCLGLLVSGVGIYFSFKNVPFDSLMRYLPTINPFWVIPSVLIVVATFVMRAIRWQMILGSSQHVTFWRAFHPLMIGFMINCVLPGRVGEVARPVILQAREKVPFSTGLATVAAERIFDLIMLISLFACVFFTVGIEESYSVPFGDYVLNKETLTKVAGGMAKLSLFMVFGFILVSIPRSRSVITGWILKIPDLMFFLKPYSRERVREVLAKPITDFVENLAPGLMLLRDARKVALCLGLSVIIWSLYGVSYYLLSLGAPGVSVSFPEMTAVMVIVCFFIALPSVPGFWGLWEAGGIFALTLFGVSLKEAAGFTLANHAVQMFPVMLIGLISALLTGVNIWRISYEPEPISGS